MLSFTHAAKSSSVFSPHVAAWVKDNKNARGDQEKANKAAERIGKCAIESGVSLEKLQSALSGL